MGKKSRCFVALLSATTALGLHAGSAPVSLGSGDGVGLSDGLRINTKSVTVPPATVTNFVNVIQTTGSSNQVSNPRGECIAVTPKKLAVISEAMAVTGPEAQAASQQLAEQISSELEGETVEIELLDFSTGSFLEAADSANNFVDDLDSELLETAMYSPTLMVILNLLGARMDLLKASGSRSCAGDADTAAAADTLFSQDNLDPRNLGLIKISLSP